MLGNAFISRLWKWRFINSHFDQLYIYQFSLFASYFFCRRNRWSQPLVGDFHSRVQYLVEHDIDSLVGGIVRRMAEDDFRMSPNAGIGWWHFYSAPSAWADATPIGQVVADKFGIKVSRLRTPVELDAK